MVSAQGGTGRAEESADGFAGNVPGWAPLIDPEAVERLRQLDPSGQHGVLDRVLRAYEASLRRHLSEMASEAVVSDPERVARAMHTLKSSSAAIGAGSFAQRCADIEQAVRSSKSLPPSEQVEAMIHEGRLVLAAVGTMLAP
jgi:histidine phosphotransfer protein HptB